MIRIDGGDDEAKRAKDEGEEVRKGVDEEEEVDEVKRDEITRRVEGVGGRER